MRNLGGKQAIEKFVERYDNDIEFDDRDTVTLKINVPSEDNFKGDILTLGNVFLPEIGGDEKQGLAMTVAKLDKSRGFESSIAKVDPDSDLAFYLRSQALPNLTGFGLAPVYDLGSLITHDDKHHKVNFVWIESMTGIKIPNKNDITAGKILFDYMQALSEYANIDAALAIGERAKLYAGVFMDRMGIPYTCSRPEGQKMLKDVIRISSTSAYDLESGEVDKLDESAEKGHLISQPFMENNVNGRRIGIIDDLDATRNTLNPFIQVVEEYGGVPVPITVNHLAYLPSDIIVPLPHEVYSIFEEKTVTKPRITQEMRQAWNQKYNC